MIIFCLAALPACHAFHMNESVVVSYVAHPISNACTLFYIRLPRAAPIRSCNTPGAAQFPGKTTLKLSEKSG